MHPRTATTDQAGSVTRRRTYCRLCEAGCGLVAEVGPAGRIQRVAPDRDHPVTQGFACNKGLLTGEIHHDPDRLDHPQARAESGEFRTVGWDEALDGIAGRLREVIDRHGPSSVAAYIGNPGAFNALAGPAAGLFVFQLGGSRLFAASTQDCNNKFAISEVLFGSAHVHLIPDLDRTDHLLLLGTNPRVSKGSFLSVPNPVAKLAEITARGGTVRFVDPRHSEPVVGETVQIRPDTDAYLLAAMLHEIDRSVGFDAAALARAKNVDGLRAFLAAFAPERVAPVVGLDAGTIIRMAREFAAAPAASAHMSTGVNMGRQGALAYWLLHLLVLFTGNLDRPGGNVSSTRGLPAHGGADVSPDSFVRSKWGDYRPVSAIQPGALLADMINDDESPIRALFVVAGNPLLTIGGGDRLADALRGLDLLVCLDFYRNATGELADYALPTADWFEREDLNNFVQGTQPRPYLEWADRIVEPVGERREEWRIFAALGERLGLAPVLRPDSPDVMADYFDTQLAAGGLSMAALRRAEGGITFLDPTEPGTFLDRNLPGDGLLDCAPEILAGTFARAHQIFDELATEPADALKLISRRTLHTLNSALQNVEKLKRTRAADNPLYLHPVDAERLGVDDGGAVRVASAHGKLEATASLDPSLRPGVVAMTHGFGNQDTTGMPVARRFPGVNVNALAPSGPGTFDPISVMSHLTGIAVTVEPVAAGGGVETP
ncbi:molybdopterin-dependent oxidoreductase [Frankia sp. CNm7]|uniref:Molybdopterin-dependent oxidoreductase n=1 Tax=Frankia nepalensis TaxID=1836974 RepID=A0A937UPK5_9ACTN|nr:molybdopterin-dependent oxidoreductase [Frankia nepalensis]MBL7502335.1 molybdopterin-dependent oxidoreductase [Frankia nepalensis]MBL7516164.1 molybdopterin-dependent oxidoreductase [Frankia nepalensis]MBL7522053.1 molybdopterin-dependent oxidoreductase [Frankia nepalensis]MBL7625666.1 molybdopterin-dependent oxidoreductase [Frankia nepalensis]